MLLLKTFKALNGLLYADVLLRNYSLTHSLVSVDVIKLAMNIIKLSVDVFFYIFDISSQLSCSSLALSQISRRALFFSKNGPKPAWTQFTFLLSTDSPAKPLDTTGGSLRFRETPDPLEELTAFTLSREGRGRKKKGRK